MDQMNAGGKNMCGCPHHKVIPVLIMLFGLLFLLGNLNMVSAGLVQKGWPVLVILGGLMKMTKGKCTCCMKQ